MLAPLRLLSLVFCALAMRAEAAEATTPVERTWIEAGMPVVRHARARELPLDLVVQPGAQPDASPVALAVRDGRCLLVLSMRGNPAADALLAGLPTELFEPVVEAVFAHEIGHCWRWMQGAWHALPAGFADPAEDPLPATPDASALAALRQTMRETRREEAYADLVALAWTRRAHPAEYAVVRAWLERFRDDAVPGDHHDTGAWLQLADMPDAFSPSGDIFVEALGLWERGLQLDAETQPSKGGGPSASMR
jgi:hypothetical protein